MMTSLTAFYNQNKAEGMKIRKGYSVALSLINPDFDKNIRPLDEQHVANLCECYKRGDDLPSLVLSLEPGGLHLVGGRHRYAAAQRAGLKELPCDIHVDMTPTDKAQHMLLSAEGLPLTQLQKARGVQALRAEGNSVADIAVLLNVSKTDVENKLLLASATEVMLQYLEEGIVSATTIIEYIRKWGEDAEEAMIRDVKRAAEGGSSKLQGKSGSRAAKFSAAKLASALEILCNADYDIKELKQQEGEVSFTLGVDDAKELIGIIEDYQTWNSN